MMSTLCAPLSISTPPPETFGLLFQRGHVDPAGEGVFEQDHFTQNAAGDDALGADHILDVAELGSHGQQRAALPGRHPAFSER